MKQKILLVSLGAAGLATLFGILGVYSGHVVGGDLDATVNTFISSVRYYQLAGICGLFGIASFFVGLAYPATTVETSTVDDRGYMSTKEIVNK